MGKIFNYLLYIVLPSKFYAKLRGVKIGYNCQISTKQFGSEPFLIEIGNHVHVTKGVKFINHDGGVWVFREAEPKFDVFGKIKIGNNTFIGNDSTILYGISIGDNCIIGAGSVITKSIPDGVIAAGNPAKYIGKTEDYYRKITRYNTNLKTSRNKKGVLLEMDDSMFIKRNEIVV